MTQKFHLDVVARDLLRALGVPPEGGNLVLLRRRLRDAYDSGVAGEELVPWEPIEAPKAKFPTTDAEIDTFCANHVPTQEERAIFDRVSKAIKNLESHCYNGVPTPSAVSSTLKILRPDEGGVR